MMNLSDLSKTGILTLISRVVASRRKPETFKDPMAELCLENLEKVANKEERAWIEREKKIFNGSQREHAIQGAQRSRMFDQAAIEFMEKHPGGCIVNIGCGFDTRFWRIARDGCRYIEVDLPEVVEAKKAALAGKIDYELISCPVMNERWIEKVVAGGNYDILILAEGLFDYLTKLEIETLLAGWEKRLGNSKLVFDILDARFSKGIWKKLVDIETKQIWGIDIKWFFGIKDPAEIEAIGKGLKIEKIKKRQAGLIISVLINAA